MEKYKKEYVYKLLYSEDKDYIIGEIKKITNSELLHIIAGNYNWDNGFEIPYSIINNENCDLGTALMIFYDADGYRILESNDEIEDSNLEVWIKFITELKQRILGKQYKVNNIKFIPPLTRVQIFKLKKSNANIDNVFLQESEGDVVEVPSMQ